jgi:peptidyl-prolyl cis-trans isomerase D
MLHTMRRVGGSIFAKILIIMLVISFAVWGVGDMLRDHSSSQVATVGHDYIPAVEFANQRSLMRQAMASLGIKNLDEKTIDDEILRRLVQQRLVRLWLEDAGLAVNRDTLAEAIKNNRQFKDITGKFDKEIFAQTLKQQRLTETSYLAQLRDEIGGIALQSSLEMSDADMPQALINLETAVAMQTRDVLLVTIPRSAGNANSITEQQLQDYYNAHKTQRYMEPERRTLEYVIIDSGDIQSMINQSITDTVLRERYESQKPAGESFESARAELLKQLQSEKRDTVLQDFNIAVEDAIAGGNSMGEALAKAGVKSQSKLLTRITATQVTGGADALLRAVSDQGFAVNDGESSGLQSTNDGRYFMVSVKETIPAAPKAFDAVKTDVREHVAKQSASDAVYEKASRAREALLLTDIGARNAALSKLGVSTRTVTVARPTLDANGQIKSDASLPALLSQAIFDRRLNEVAGPIAAADGSAVVALVVATHQPPASTDAASLAKLQTNYKASLNDAVIGATFNALAARYEVSINQPLLKQLTQPAAP